MVCCHDCVTAWPLVWETWEKLADTDRYQRSQKVCEKDNAWVMENCIGTRTNLRCPLTLLV